MTHADAWLIAGRDIMWAAIALAPAGLLSERNADSHAFGLVLYTVVMSLCYCAGAGYI